METPKMLNWLCRYAVATSALLDQDRTMATSLLDVGSGPHGFACTESNVPFVGVDMSFPLPPAPSMLAVRNAPGRLPFADASFGAVISLDVLEHVPPGERSGFVAELTRVSAGQTIVACPSSEMSPVDDALRAMFLRTGIPIPGWLSEHYEHGLPTPAEIAEHCAPSAGFTAHPIRTPNGVLSAMSNLVDFTPETTRMAAADATSYHADWLALFENAVFGESSRKAYVIEREQPTAPIVEQGELQRTVLRALRCPRCASPTEPLAPLLLRCIECQHLVARDRAGVWDLRPGPSTFWHEPEWHAELLAPLLHGFADLDHPEARLILRARPEIIDGASALACAAAALGDRALAEHVDVVVLAEGLAPAEEQTRRSDAVIIDPEVFAGLPTAGTV